MKVIIVGGVAGGASCAARLRLSYQKAEIIMGQQRGPATCLMPTAGCPIMLARTPLPTMPHKPTVDQPVGR